MFWRLFKKRSVWKSRKVRIIAVVLAVLFLFVVGYKLIPFPYIEGVDVTETVNKVSFNAPFTLHFSQNMNKESVENNFSIHPRIKGDFIWQDGKTLEYHPKKDLSIGDRYRVTIGSEAHNIYGKSLGSDNVLHFLISGPPYVKFVSPYFPIEGQVEGLVDEPLNSPSIAPQLVPIVSSDQIITVMFDRPMQWPDYIHTQIEGMGENLLLTDPLVSGEYRFLGTSAFQFIPKAWPTGTRFKLTVPAGIQSRDGGKTEKEMSWYVETSPLHIIETIPTISDERVDINTSISVRFNQPVDLNQIRPGANALLFPSNDLDSDENLKYDGFFNTEVTYGKDDQGNQDKAVLIFKPTFPYQYNTEYKFVIKAGLSGASVSETEGIGALGMKEDFELIFNTVLSPGIVEFEPPSNNYPNILATFSTAMTVKEIQENLIITPKPITPVTIIMSEDSKQAEILCGLSYNTEYSFELNAPLKDAAGNDINENFKATFTTGNPTQELRWETDENMDLFIEGIDPEFTFQSKNVDELDLELCQVTDRNFMVTNEKNGWKDYRCYDEPVPLRVSSDSRQTLLNLTTIFNREWAPGIYYLSVKSSDKKIYKVFFVSNTNLFLKKSPDGLLLWATDFIIGDPISRMELVIYDYDGIEIARGVTDGDGIYKITRNLDEGIYVIGKKNLGEENRWALINEYWLTPEQNISGKNINNWANVGDSKVYLISDKNIVRAGDDLNVKGIWRIDNDAQLALPKDTQITLAVEDVQQNTLIKKVLPMRRNGSFDDVLEIPTNISSGSYRLTVYNTSGDRIDTNETVINITKNDSPFEMNWINPQNNFYLKDIVVFDLKAHYLVGLPAASLKGSWELFGKPYYYNYEKNGRFYSFGEVDKLTCSKGACPEKEKLIANGEFGFDPDGFSQIVVTDKEENFLKAGYEYTLVATAESVDGNHVSKFLSFVVHPGKFYLGLSSKHYLHGRGENIEAVAIATDTEGNPIENKRVEISLIQKSGKFQFNKIIEINNEPAEISIPVTSNMPDGVYRLRAESNDEIGNDIFAELEFYITSESEKAIADNLMLLLDQPEYFVGGKAHLLINAPYASSENPIMALMTYERAGILGYQMIDLSSPLTEVEIPIIKEMVPNIYVSLTLIRHHSKELDMLLKNQAKRRLGAEQRQTEVEIILLEDELESISEDGDEEEIEKLKSKIELLKENITPVDNESDLSTEITYPTIEKSVANIIIGNPDHKINIDIIPHPLNPRPGEEVTVKLHTYDYQNRPVPSVITLSVVEKQLGQMDVSGISPIEYFYNPRALEVFTSSNTNIAESPLTEAITGPLIEVITGLKIGNIYSAFFSPLILTDENGYGEITFTLPDKHMTWQINAIATSDEQQFGNTNYNLYAKKPLAITPIIPAFAIPGDQITASAQIQNLSEDDMETSIELLADDFDVKGGTKKNVFIKSGQTIKVDWNIEIGPFNNEEVLKIAFRIQDDYIESKLPIKSLKVSESLNNSGVLEDEWIGKMRISSDTVSSMGYLNISLSPTPFNLVKKYSDAFLSYPHLSTEAMAGQLISKVVTGDDDIQEMVMDVEGHQRIDGGYGFWQKAEESKAWLTAFTVYALRMASDDFDVSADGMNTAIRYLWTKLGALDSLTDRLFILWALSEVGQYDTSTTLADFKNREESTISGRGFLLMNINNLIQAGQKSIYPFLERLKAEIVSDQIIEDELVYFEDENKGSLDSDVRSTAITLFTLSRLSEDNPLLLPLVKYLISLTGDVINRFNPQEAIWVLLALNEFTEEQKGMEVSYTAKAEVNQKTVIDESIKTENVKDIYSVKIPLNELKDFDQINEIKISKDGSGLLYFDAELKYYLQNEKVLPIEEGIVITRNYYDLEDFDLLKPVSEMKSGALYRGVINLVTPEDYSYLAVEIPLPAGVKALSFNPSIGNTSWRYEQEEFARLNGLTWIDNPLWNFDNKSIEDDRLMIYSENLPAGVYTIDYLVQAGLPGKYNHLPTSAQLIFNPTIQARTSGEWIEIK